MLSVSFSFTLIVAGSLSCNVFPDECHMKYGPYSEADMVILSCVRSNALRTIGFLSNKHRMCVAISRARERLVVIGSAHTLGTDKFWSKLHSVASQAMLNADVIPKLVHQVRIYTRCFCSYCIILIAPHSGNEVLAPVVEHITHFCMRLKLEVVATVISFSTL